MKRLWFGQPALLGDVNQGEVCNLIVDPAARRVSHLVVGPPSHPEKFRRVALSQVRLGGEDAVRLDLSQEEFRRLPLVRDSVYQRPSRAVSPGRDWDVGIRKPASDTRYSYKEVPRSEFEDERTVEIVFDRIPKGSVELRSESRFVLAAGSDAGSVTGVAIGDEDLIAEVMISPLRRMAQLPSSVPSDLVLRFEMDRVVSSLASPGLGSLARAALRRFKAPNRE